MTGKKSPGPLAVVESVERAAEARRGFGAGPRPTEKKKRVVLEVRAASP